MAFLARRLVSTNKRRYQQDGYDLDLSYITPRIIAMGFPCDSGVSRLYRNPADQVIRLLEERHGGHYKLYNLCIERGYDAAAFGGRVMRLPMHDGQAPPLHLLLALCRDAAAWLAAHPAHVAVLHCKAGKGRTGAAACALLLALDPHVGPASLESTLALWARQRTRDGKGLTIPSQRRFVEYFHRLLLASVRDNVATQDATASAPPAANCRPAAQEERPASHDQHPAAQPCALILTPGCQPPEPQSSPHAALHALRIAQVPHRAARLLRVRFSGLPTWLLRDCTASIWWRPTGHYQAHSVCHVHTRPAGAGCWSTASRASSAVETSSAVTCVTQPRVDPSSGKQAATGELVLELAGLPPLPTPPPPSPLPYITLPPPPPPPLFAYEMPAQQPCAASKTANQTQSECTVVQKSSGPGFGGGKDSGSGGPVLAGDVKIQLFRGQVKDPKSDVFQGRVTQFSVWINTGFLDPRVGVLELGRTQLDKLSKPLRRWRGAVGLVVEYEVAC